MAKVVATTGKACSGKTYYSNSINAVRLSVDDLILRMYDFCLGDKYLEAEDRALLFLYSQAEQLVKKGIDVIIDYGFWYKYQREFCEKFFCKKNIAFEFVYFDVPFEQRLKWLNERNKILKNSTKREYILTQQMLIDFDKKYEE